MTDRKPTLPRRKTGSDMGFGQTTPLISPLHASVVYTVPNPDAFDAIYDDEAAGFIYAREGHPNATRLASLIDGLEGGQGGLIQGSGMAAISAVMLGLLKSGDHVIASDQLYGRSLRLLKQDLPRFGIETTFVDPTQVEAFAAARRSDTKLILVEVVSNPTLRVADMAGIQMLSKTHGLCLVVDNTFTTPLGYPAFAEGADVVVHSVTKLLSGHSDVTLGYVLARDPSHRTAIYDISATLGLTPSPFDCWLAERGLYSFELRYKRAQDNAALLAEALAGHSAVEAVIYPGRPDHPDYATAKQLLHHGFGNMVSFRIAGTRADANVLTQALSEIAFAPTLGDVSTTLSHPLSSSHRMLSPSEQNKYGITEGFFRISVGIEEIDSLIASFLTGLDTL